MNNKHLMTGSKGNGKFCFPETLTAPLGEAEGNVEVEGKQNSLFPAGLVIKWFVIPPNSKANKSEEIVCFTHMNVVPRSTMNTNGGTEN